MTLVAVFFWAISAYLVWSIPPKIEDKIVLSNLSYVLLSGFLALSLTATVIHYFTGGFFVEKRRGVESAIAIKNLFMRSIRRGFLISILATSFAALNAFELFNIFNAVLLIGIIILAEIYFSSR